MARIHENGLKEVGTLILPEIHERISENYTIVHGFKSVASGMDWKEVFAKAGI